MVNLPVAVLRLTDAAVGEGVAGVIGVHPEVEMMAGVRHGQLEEEEDGVILPAELTFS